MTPIRSTVSEVDEEKDEKDTSVADGSSQYGGDSVDGESVSNDSESILSDDPSQEGLTPSILSTLSTLGTETTAEDEPTPPSSSLGPNHVDTGSPINESNLSTPLATAGLPSSSSHHPLHPHHHHHHLGITSSPPSYFGQHHVPITSHDPDDSDSTISGLPSTLRPLPPLESPPALPLPSPALPTSSNPDEDTPERPTSPFVSRIPRRARQSNAIAGLIKKFEEVDNEDEDEEEESAPNSPFVPHPKPSRHADAIFSESEQEHQPSLSSARPRIRRGRTEGTSIRVRQPSSGVLSDGETGYAAHASSRLPISASLKPPPEAANLRRAGSGSRSRSGSRPSSPAPTSPTRALRTLRPVGLGIQASSSSSSSTRPMTFGAGPVRTGSIRASKGKGKLPARLNPSTHVPTSGSRRGPVAGGLSGKVSSYARHFVSPSPHPVPTRENHRLTFSPSSLLQDGLSRDADRARQKSITAAKGKRARPVAITRVTVRTLDLRAAVKDDSDSSDSSEADDEDDGEEESRKKGRPEGTSPRPSDQSSPPQPEQDQVAFAPSSDDKEPTTVPSTSPSTDSSVPIVEQAAPKERRPSTLQLPVPGRVRDLVELDLEKFDTKAPLPSLPPTPQYPAESFSVSQSLAGHLSESEMSSAGPERQCESQFPRLFVSLLRLYIKLIACIFLLFSHPQNSLWTLGFQDGRLQSHRLSLVSLLAFFPSHELVLIPSSSPRRSQRCRCSLLPRQSSHHERRRTYFHRRFHSQVRRLSFLLSFPWRLPSSSFFFLPFLQLDEVQGHDQDQEAISRFGTYRARSRRGDRVVHRWKNGSDGVRRETYGDSRSVR